MDQLDCNISQNISENSFNILETLVLCVIYFVTVFFLRKHKIIIFFSALGWQVLKTLLVLVDRQNIDFILTICKIKSMCDYDKITLDRLIKLILKGVFWFWEPLRYLQVSDDNLLTNSPYCTGLYNDAINYRVISVLDIIEMTFWDKWIFITIYISTFIIIKILTYLFSSWTEKEKET